MSKCLNCGKKFTNYRMFCSNACQKAYQEKHTVIIEHNPRIRKLKALAKKIKQDFRCGFDDRRHNANLAKKTYYYIAKEKGFSMAESVLAINRLNHTTAVHMLKSITEDDLRCIKAYIEKGFVKKDSHFSEGERNRIRLNFRYDRV